MSENQTPAFAPLPLSNRPDGFDPNYYAEHGADGLESTFLESAKATMGLMSEDTLGSILKQQYELDQARAGGGDLVAPRELNDQYPYMEKPFTKPTTKAVAELLAERERKRQELQDIAIRGPQGAFYSAGRFGAGMIAGLMDPVELGVNIASGVALGSIARIAEIGFLTAEAPSVLQTAGRAATDAFVGSAITEPFRYAAAQENQRNYGLRDSITNVVAGSLGYGLAFGLGAAASRGVARGARYLRGVSPELEEAAARGSVGAIASDRNPMVNEMIQATEERLGPPSAPRMSEHAYTPIEDGRQLALMGDTLYASTPEKRAEYFAGPRGYIEENFGTKGTYLTDSPDVANNMAFNSSKAEFGSVFRFKVDSTDLKLVNLEAKPEGKIRDILEPFVNATFSEKRAKRLLEKGTVRDIYDAVYSLGKKGILTDAIDQLNYRFAQEGYHGLRFEGGSTTKAAKLAPTLHNVFMMFDHMDVPDKKMRIQQAEVMAPDIRQANTALSAEQARALAERAHSIYSHTLFDDADFSDLQEHMSLGEIKPVELADAQKQTKDLLNQIRVQEAQGTVAPEIKTKVEAIVKKASEDNIEDTIAQNALACMSGGLA